MGVIIFVEINRLYFLIILKSSNIHDITNTGLRSPYVLEIRPRQVWMLACNRLQNKCLTENCPHLILPPIHMWNSIIADEHCELFNSAKVEETKIKSIAGYVRIGLEITSLALKV